MFVVPPWIQRSPMVRPMVRLVEAGGIDAAGLFYTDVEETGDAETAMRDSIRFPPGAR